MGLFCLCFCDCFNSGLSVPGVPQYKLVTPYRQHKREPAQPILCSAVISLLQRPFNEEGY